MQKAITNEAKRTKTCIKNSRFSAKSKASTFNKRQCQTEN